MKKPALTIFSILSVILAQANTTDSIPVPSDTTDISAPRKLNFFQKIGRYYSEANKPHPEKKFDINFIGGPHYSTETGFGIGLAGSGIYYTSRGADNMPDSLTPPSIMTLKGDVTTGQFYKIGVEGYNIFPRNRYRINYTAYFYSFRDKFWGIGYANGNNKANESNYKRLQAEIQADFVFNLIPNFYFGPLVKFSYIKGSWFEKPQLLDGQRWNTFNSGIGFSVVFDNRDVPYNAYRGVLLRYEQVFSPKFMGNRYAFSRSTLIAAAYTKLWKGCVLASMFHADLTYGNTPWGLMPSFGGSKYMRGYYEGRFRDKNEMDITFEFRQHVWRRSGIVLWLNAGTVFPEFSAFRFKHILPGGGIGYRWEFKPRVNVRLDIGIGRGENSLNFSLNEAF